MNKQEAVSFLQGRVKLIDKYYPDVEDYREALVMAIQELKKEPCEDCISRQDAEGIFREARRQLNPRDYKTAYEFNTRDLMLLNAEQLIHQLPPVTPKKRSDKE